MPRTPGKTSDSRHPTTNASGAGLVGPSTVARPTEHVMDSIDRSNVTGNRHNMAWLCRQFPTLRGAPGAEPFDAIALHAWARGGAGTSGNRHAVRFVLQVWDHGERWALGDFNLVAAFAAWDDDHRRVVLRWASAPWFP